VRVDVNIHHIVILRKKLGASTKAALANFTQIARCSDATRATALPPAGRDG
jgi:hypothetical protein